MSAIYTSADQLIGKTPLMELTGIEKKYGLDAKIIAKLEMFNPMYHYVNYIRNLLLYQITPSLKLNLACAGFAVISLLVGWIAFRRNERKFILYI